MIFIFIRNLMKILKLFKIWIKYLSKIKRLKIFNEEELNVPIVVFDSVL